jgi:hypothetical protein
LRHSAQIEQQTGGPGRYICHQNYINGLEELLASHRQNNYHAFYIAGALDTLRRIFRESALRERETWANNWYTNQMLYIARLENQLNGGIQQ